MTEKHLISDYGSKLVGRKVVLYNALGEPTEPEKVLQVKTPGPGDIQSTFVVSMGDGAEHEYSIRDYMAFSFAEELEPDEQS